jgi:CRP/FNR family transcriptional regulator
MRQLSVSAHQGRALPGRAHTAVGPIAPQGPMRHYETGSLLYHAGDAAEAAFAIRSGFIKLLSYSANGRARIVRLLGPGDIAGLEGLFKPVLSHTAVAIADVELRRVALPALRRVRSCRPEVYARLMEHGYEQLRSADTWILQFSTGEIRDRVQRLLDFLATIEFGAGSRYVHLLKCREMAEVLGVTPESVSRILAELKRRRDLVPVGTEHDQLYERRTSRGAQDEDPGSAR